MASPSSSLLNEEGEENQNPVTVPLCHPEEEKKLQQEKISFRSIFAFWMLGLCNNYGFVVMLTAAHDILSPEEIKNTTKNVRQCNKLSTGAILLADIIPSLGMKLIAPLFPLSIHFRMAMVLLFYSVGFIIVANAGNYWIALVGVVCTAISSGLGDISLLSYISSYKNKIAISLWSSGTGGAGFLGSLTYTGLNNCMTKSNTLYSLLGVPVLMGLSFWVLLEKPCKNSQRDVEEETKSQSNLSLSDDNNIDESASSETFSQKLKVSHSLLKYTIPLFFLYFFEYLINLGLAELVQFHMDWLSYEDQYKWFHVTYQIGVFGSRSSISLVQVNNIWILAVLQGINLILFTYQAVYSYMPSFFVSLLLVYCEGLLGGTAYVNTHYKILNEVQIEKQEFAMAFTSLSETVGIILAGFSAILVHNFICKLPKY